MESRQKIGKFLHYLNNGSFVPSRWKKDPGERHGSGRVVGSILESEKTDFLRLKSQVEVAINRHKTLNPNSTMRDCYCQIVSEFGTRPNFDLAMKASFSEMKRNYPE